MVRKTAINQDTDKNKNKMLVSLTILKSIMLNT